MYLKYLAVEGFKSFPERSGLELAPGTCIFVGANGTGKSNLTDAVSWVLGQRDLASLRARDAADLVFAGSDELLPLEEASVTVVLDPRPERERGEALSALVCKHGHKAVHSDEVPDGALTITRQVTLSGDDRFFIDGSEVEPSQMHSTLADRGVSSPPVTVIRQGELERLLFLDPMERRRVIETAARIPVLEEELGPLLERRAAGELRREHLIGELEAAGELRARLLDEREALLAARALESRAASLRAAAVRDALADDSGARPPAVDLSALLRVLGLPDVDPANDGPSGGVDDLGALSLPEVLRRLDALGPLNTRAELDLADLDAHVADLERELARLGEESEAVSIQIEHLRSSVATAFEAALARIAERFRTYYGLLAPGGEADLVVVDLADDGNETETARGPRGVDVVVRPPGKVLDRVAALSGGERSLAALSLALAVFLEHPSPFFVLDEVEPALDDTNVRRLQAVLDLVADQRQILMVSHQQRAKETGDVVFGVERNLDGASQVKYRYEPRTRRLDIYRRTWAADHLRRRPLAHGSGHAPGVPDTMGGAGSPTQASLVMATPGPGAGPNRYRQRLFHEDGTFRGIWDALGNEPTDATAASPEAESEGDAEPSGKPCC